MIHHLTRREALALAGAALATSSAHAQGDWPTGPIRVVCWGEQKSANASCSSPRSASRSAAARRDLPMPGLAAQQHRLPLARPRTAPAAEQQLHLLLAPDQRRRVARRAAPRSGSRRRPRRAPARRAPGPGMPFSSAAPRSAQENSAPVSRRVAASTTTAPGSARACRRAARFGVSPTTPRSRASPSPMTSPTTTEPVAMPTRAASGPAEVSQARDGRRRGEAGAHRALGVVLVRRGPAEVRQHTVAEQLGDVTAILAHRFDHSAVVGRHHLAQVLRVEPGRERRRAREVAEQHRQMPALRARSVRVVASFGSAGRGRRARRLRGRRLRGRLRTARNGRRRAAQRGDGGEQLAAVPDRGDAHLLQVVGRQLREHRSIDAVVAERRLVLAEAKAAEPGRYVHASLTATACPSRGPRRDAGGPRDQWSFRQPRLAQGADPRLSEGRVGEQPAGEMLGQTRAAPGPPRGTAAPRRRPPRAAPAARAPDEEAVRRDPARSARARAFRAAASAASCRPATSVGERKPAQHAREVRTERAQAQRALEVRQRLVRAAEPTCDPAGDRLRRGRVGVERERALRGGVCRAGVEPAVAEADRRQGERLWVVGLGRDRRTRASGPPPRRRPAVPPVRQADGVAVSPPSPWRAPDRDRGRRRGGTGRAPRRCPPGVSA